MLRNTINRLQERKAENQEKKSEIITYQPKNLENAQTLFI